MCLETHAQSLAMVTPSRPYGFSICTCHLNAFKPLTSPCAAEHFSLRPCAGADLRKLLRLLLTWLLRCCCGILQPLQLVRAAAE